MRRNGILDRIYLFVLLFIVVIASVNFAVGQEMQTGSIVYNEGAYSYDITVLYENLDVKPSNDIMYYWYRNGNLRTTIGEYSGNLLHGCYEKFDGLGRLRMKGTFNLGTKEGEWKTWNLKGKLSSIEKWKNGYLKIRTSYLNDTIKIEAFKNNLLNGKLIKLVEGKVVSSISYRDGKLKTKKELKFFARLRKTKNKVNEKDAKSE